VSYPGCSRCSGELTEPNAMHKGEKPTIDTRGDPGLEGWDGFF
jgi:hypothetical protein